MMEDIKTGKVNCVVTKDLSRFGRNHIETGRYIERIFPRLGVRFIAINDNYDSIAGGAQTDYLMVAFRNLINDAYCRDISMKIRSSLEVKRKKGDFTGPFAPYGYRKSESDKNILETDGEAADIVRLIFRMYLQGNNAHRIAEDLNQKGILTPMDYKRRNGSLYDTGFRKKQESRWTHAQILRILGNPVYKGTLAQGKETTPNYKVKKKIRRPRGDWCLAEGAHEAVISEADFENVQRQLQMDTRSCAQDGKVCALSGIVRCAGCGTGMVRKTVPSGKKKFVYYVCAGHKGNRSVCSPHGINAQKLEECIRELINCRIREDADLESVLGKLDGACRWGGMRRQIEGKKREVERYERLRQELHEDFRDGLLTEEEYLELKEMYESRVCAGRQALEAMEAEAASPGGGQGCAGGWIEELKKSGRLTCLPRELAVSLIGQILVYEKKEGERCPGIEVRFKYAQTRKDTGI